MSVLSVKDLCKEYASKSRKFIAVKNVSLEVESGDFVNIIGRSGSGKSTLLNMIAGMLTPTSGEVYIDGEALSLKNDAELSRIRNDKIGFIPQWSGALGNLTVRENIMLPFSLYPHGGDGEGYSYILMERLGIDALADSYPSELSGGELRRVLIARAMINRPRIIIADEPTSDLDGETSRSIMEEFARLNAEGTTLLLVSHDIDTLKYGKRVFEMIDGRLEARQ